MDHFSMLTPHEQLVKHKNLKLVLHNLLYIQGCNFQERFIKNSWNSLWTTRDFRWTTGGPSGPR